MTKQQVRNEAQALGLSPAGTKAQIQQRIDDYWAAMAEAGHDTAQAAYVDGSDLGPVPSGDGPAAGGIHPVNALVIGGALGAIAHFCL